MNEPKFRGKNIKTGEWVYGVPIPNGFGKRVFIIRLQLGESIAYPLEQLHDFCVEVEPETVGQYTGLKDKNGVEIFEGDVVRAFSNINKISDPHLTETIEPEYDSKVVIYSNGAFVLSDDGKREYGGVLNHYVGAMTKDLEVIGNIHENPELLNEVE